MSELAVIVNRVAFPPATDTCAKWYILQTDKGTAKGKMSFRPKDLESIVLFGEWTVYRGNKEFKFDGARLNVPANPRDQLRYVIERTPGAGSAIEDLVWEHSGANWKAIKAGEVPRLNGALYERFQNQISMLSQNEAQAEVVGALLGKGCTPAMAQKAFDQWKGETLGVVNSDPFRLAELDGYGFSHVDKGIRQCYDIADDDPRRISAAVVYSLRRLTDTGSTVVAWQDLFASACAALGGYDNLVFEATKELLKVGTLKGFNHGEGFISLSSDYRAEEAIWNFANGVSSNDAE